MAESTETPRLDAIPKLEMAAHLAFAAMAGLQLDLFTPLADGPRTCQELAAALGVSLASLRPLLYALVLAGLLTVDDDRFSNTAEADQYLVRGRPSYAGGIHEIWRQRWQAEMRTADSVRTGVAQAKMDWSTMSDDDLMAFFRGGAGTVTRGGRLTAERYDLSQCRRLGDIGGGSGHLALAMVQACPGLKATVVDLPRITAFARRFIEEAGLGERVDVISADITLEPLRVSFDFAVMKGVLQTLSPEQARLALLNAAPAIAPGGTLQIHGRILDDSRLSPPDAVAMNIVFLNLFDGGQAHTEREHREWLQDAGFVDVTRDRLPDGVDVLIARKPN